MALALDKSLRRALAAATRALEERIALAQGFESQAIGKGHDLLARTWAERAAQYQREADLIRSSLERVDELAAAFARTSAEATIPGQRDRET
jgi:two-component system, chemotaxis family, protein-glutamate methylesterase/glutaminase